MLINRRHRKKQKPPCQRWRAEVGNVVVYTKNVQFGERHHHQWDSEKLFFQALNLGDDEPKRQVELLTQAIALTPRDADCYITRGIRSPGGLQHGHPVETQECHGVEQPRFPAL